MTDASTTRISVELPRDLVRRLDHQALLTRTPRRRIIEAAILDTVREFEAAR
jgi:predicted transcriptional regulator